MEELGITPPLPFFQSYQRRVHPALITQDTFGYSLSRAIWWFALKRDKETWVPNEKITSFNARNLDGKLWKTAIERRRGVVFATEVGESKGRDRYLMRTDQGLALGAVYQDWHSSDDETVRSMAIITRPPHPRFSKYHDKSIPMFLPLDAEIIKLWLDPDNGSEHPQIQDLLSHPKIYTPLAVTPVKSFVRAEPLGETDWLSAD